MARAIWSLLWVPVFLVVFGLGAVTATLGENPTQDFWIGLLVGTGLALIASLVPIVLHSWRAAKRSRKVLEAEPNALVWEGALDPSTASSLSALGAPISSRPHFQFGAHALTVGVTSDAVHVFAGYRSVEKIFTAHLHSVERVTVVSVHNGWRSIPAVRLDLVSDDASCPLFLTLRSKQWPWATSGHEARLLRDKITSLSLRQDAGGPRPKVELSSGPVGRIQMLQSFSARSRFATFRRTSDVLLVLYIAGVVGKFAEILTASLPDFFRGLAASPVNLLPFVLILYALRLFYGRAFYGETLAGYTTLRWLVGVFPQVDEATGSVIRRAGEQPLSRSQEKDALSARSSTL